MTSPARGASDGMGGDISPALLKGGILVLVALLLGTFLLYQGPDNDIDASSGPPATDSSGDDGDEPPATDSDGSNPDTSDTTGDTGGTTTTEASAEARPPEEVTVLVANASGIPGAAGKIGEDLTAEGYIVAEPDNAKEPSSTTAVYYIPGFEAEARAVAEVLGLDPDAEGVVAEVPSPLPTQDENMGAANVLVILGTDEAPTA